MNVCDHVSPDRTSGEEKDPPSGAWLSVSSLIHVTVSPTVIVMSGGVNVKLVMRTFVVAADA